MSWMATDVHMIFSLPAQIHRDEYAVYLL